MKTALAIIVLSLLTLVLAAQPRPQPVPQAPPQPPAVNLNGVLADLQKTTQTANVDLSKLRIEKWKVDDSQKQQMQQVADSLRKNITMAVPGLINEVQAAPNGVSKAFKLYHDLNVVYEYMNSLAEAAGAYGKKDEYTPLAGDVTALDNVRQHLSTYIERSADTLETQLQQALLAQQQQQQRQQAQAAQVPKKIVINDDNPPAKKTVKKKKPAAKPTPTPAQSSSPPQ